MKVLKGYVWNPNRPKGCIAQCYIAEEAIEFCSEFLVDLESVGVPSIRNATTNVGDNGIYDGKTIGRGTVVEIDDFSWEQAHRYVLQNTEDVQPYIE